MTMNQSSPLETLRSLSEGNSAWRSHGRSPGLELAPVDGPRRAAVVCCSDLRCSPEVAFNQRFGDLLVVQVPGPFVDSSVTSTLRYGIEALGVSLVMVLTHDDCAVLHAQPHAERGRASGFLEHVDRELEGARHAGLRAAKFNAEAQAKRLALELERAVTVVPAVMHRDGEVELLEVSTNRAAP
jgi:carbonic anhydrase